MKFVDISKKYYRCDVCKQMKPWTKDSATYGSMALDDYYGSLAGSLITCSTKCRGMIDDPEKWLKRKLKVKTLRIKKLA